MKLTAHEKQFWIPLATLLVSVAWFASFLGSLWSLAAIPTLAGSVGMFGYYNGDRLAKRFNDWMSKDD